MERRRGRGMKEHIRMLPLNFHAILHDTRKHKNICALLNEQLGKEMVRGGGAFRKWKVDEAL